MNHAGAVLLAVAALWIAYLVPHRLRLRQELLESRTDDRFSEGLRVLRVARPAGTVATRRQSTARVLLHPPRAGGGGPMDRPHGATDRVVADAARKVAAERAHRVAELARRRAAARRRSLLTTVLLGASVLGWVVVGVSTVTVVAAAVPTLLLAGVLVAGRRAAVTAARADAAWAAGAATRATVPAITAGARTVGRAVRPSDAQTEVIRRVPSRPARSVDRPAEGRARPAGRPAARPGAAAGSRADRDARATGASRGHERPAAVGEPSQRDETAGPATVPAGAPSTGAAPAPAAEHVAGAAASTWSPVPVPPPAYTLKPAAPRREPAPLPTVAAVEDEAAAASTDVRTAAGSAPTLDLDAILARRRAAGE